MKNYKRVHFLLDEEQYNKFEKISQKRGIPKSKLLCEWIDKYCFKDNIGGIHNTNRIKDNYFNCRIDRKLLKTVTEASDELGVNLSNTIRSVINHALNNEMSIQTESVGTNIINLYKKGLLKNITQLIDNPESLDRDELITYANTLLEIGDVEKASNILNLIEDRISVEKDESKFFARYFLLKGESLRLQFKTEASIELLQKAIIFSDNNIEILGRIYDQIALIKQYKSDLIGAKKYYKIADTLFTRIKYSPYHSEVLTKLAYIDILNADFNSAENYINEAKHKKDISNNKYFQGRYHHIKSIVELHKGNLENAKEEISKGIVMQNQSGSDRGKLNLISNMGYINIAEGNFDFALSNFKKAYQYEVNLQRRVANGNKFNMKTNFYMIFLRSIDNYYDAIEEMNMLSESNNQKIFSERFEYFINSIKYLNGISSDLKREGMRGLSTLHKKAKSKLISNGSLNTLNYKRIEIIR